jgi:hypothetical protein
MRAVSLPLLRLLRDFSGRSRLRARLPTPDLLSSPPRGERHRLHPSYSSDIHLNPMPSRDARHHHYKQNCGKWEQENHTVFQIGL